MKKLLFIFTELIISLSSSARTEIKMEDLDDAGKEFETSPEVFFKDKDVCITGKIEFYKDKPQIIVGSKSQILLAQQDLKNISTHATRHNRNKSLQLF